MLVGRLLITLSLIAAIIGSLVADWNDTHVFNPEWSPHARFHVIVEMGMTTGFYLIGLRLLWRKSSDFRAHLFVATAAPVLACATFFLAMLVPGAGVEDHPGTLPRIFGLPFNIFLVLCFSGIAVIGYILCLRASRAGR
jgi:hypothetical protein